MKKMMVLVISMIICFLVFGSLAQAKKWFVPGDFPDIPPALNSPLVVDHDWIIVKGPGNFTGDFLSKSVKISGVGWPTINFGPAHSSGLIMGFRLLAGSDGATIEGLVFKVDLDIMNGDGVEDVAITHNSFISSIQGVSNWRGNNWIITHNVIKDLRTSNGGGIGILVGDFAGGTVSGNLVANNKIIGVLTSMPGELGGYDGDGIVLYADFRWGGLGSLGISYNWITKNEVGLKDGSDMVGVIAFEMTDTRDDEALPPVILNNLVNFNDFRRTEQQIVLTPENLKLYNAIYKN